MIEQKVKYISVEEILESPFSYENMLVHVKYKTFWRNMGNQMRQEEVYYTGRISFISTSIIQIANDHSVITVPLGYFIWIEKAGDPPLVHILAKENFELKHKISELKNYWRN